MVKRVAPRPASKATKDGAPSFGERLAIERPGGADKRQVLQLLDAPVQRGQPGRKVRSHA